MTLAMVASSRGGVLAFTSGHATLSAPQLANAYKEASMATDTQEKVSGRSSALPPQDQLDGNVFDENDVLVDSPTYPGVGRELTPEEVIAHRVYVERQEAAGTG